MEARRCTVTPTELCLHTQVNEQGWNSHLCNEIAWQGQCMMWVFNGNSAPLQVAGRWSGKTRYAGDLAQWRPTWLRRKGSTHLAVSLGSIGVDRRRRWRDRPSSFSRWLRRGRRRLVGEAEWRRMLWTIPATTIVTFRFYWRVEQLFPVFKCHEPTRRSSRPGVAAFFAFAIFDNKAQYTI
jgi:hypothetical protein